MASLFKIRCFPNPDGTESTTVIDNSNTAFVHTYVGDDFTGDGTRECPYKSAFKANQKSGISNIIFRGVINEAFSTTKPIIGDDQNQSLIILNSFVSSKSLLNLTIDGLDLAPMGGACIGNIIIKSHFTGTDNYSNSGFFLCMGLLACTDMGIWRNITVSNYKSTQYGYGSGTVMNYIIIDEFNVIRNNGTAIHKYCLILSSAVFKFNDIVINPVFTNDSKANIQILRDAFITAGMSQEQCDGILFKDSFGNETNRIVLEERNGGTSGNVFNKYDDNDGKVLDYSLNPASNNEALYASDLGGYVGCFKPASRIDNADLSEPVNVNESGVDSGEQGTLLTFKQVNGVQSIEFTTGTGQKWNRARTTNTISIPNGVKFPGVNCLSDDGSAFGYYFGKHQNLMGTVAYPADILEPNTIYKVCNLNRDIYSAAIYNGTQYLPDYFFKTGTEVLNFSLLNEGSGTFVRKVLATPLESIEVIPYDDMNTPSAFPKFSCPLFGDVQMLFWKTGERINTPILFSDIAGLTDKIPYYNDWAITNADQEFVLVSSDTENNYYKTPVLKFLRLELNAHFNVEYDQ